MLAVIKWQYRWSCFPFRAPALFVREMCFVIIYYTKFMFKRWTFVLC
jgi:hypothetical protein